MIGPLRLVMAVAGKLRTKKVTLKVDLDLDLLTGCDVCELHENRTCMGSFREIKMI